MCDCRNGYDAYRDPNDFLLKLALDLIAPTSNFANITATIEETIDLHRVRHSKKVLLLQDVYSRLQGLKLPSSSLNRSSKQFIS